MSPKQRGAVPWFEQSARLASWWAKLILNREYRRSKCHEVYHAESIDNQEYWGQAQPQWLHSQGLSGCPEEPAVPNQRCWIRHNEQLEKERYADDEWVDAGGAGEVPTMHSEAEGAEQVLRAFDDKGATSAKGVPYILHYGFLQSDPSHCNLSLSWARFNVKKQRTVQTKPLFSRIIVS